MSVDYLYSFIPRFEHEIPHEVSEETETEFKNHITATFLVYLPFSG